MGFCAFSEDHRGILCIIWSSSWDFVHYSKSIMGFCAFLEDPRGILCTFGSSSWDFVHFWKFLISYCAFLEVPHGILCIFEFLHGKAYTCPFHPFTFPLQNTCFCNIHTDCLWLSLAATSWKRHPVIMNIRITRPRLMQRRWIVTFVWWRCPSLGLNQIIFIYDFSHLLYFNNFYCK